jgi:Tfp pilus assembly protein PilO
MTTGNKERISNPYAAERSLKKVSGSIYVTGTFDQLEAFIKKVETNARIINILGLELNQAADDKLSLKCTLETYYYE